VRNFIWAIVAVSIIGFVCAGLSGCNTFQGLGEDISTLGRGIQGISGK